MANNKGKHSQLTKWKKGQSGNPGGRPKIPKDLKEAANKYNSEVIKGLLAQCLDKGVRELEEILKDKNNKVIDHLIGRIALMGIVNGDPVRFNFILDRMIGKVKENIQVEVKPVVEFETNVQLDGSLLQDVIEAEVRESERETETESQADVAEGAL